MATRSNHELPKLSGDEQDALSRRSRSLLGLGETPGLMKWWKRNYNKRVRSHAKSRIRKDLDGWR